VSDKVFETAVRPTAPLPVVGHNACRALCDHVTSAAHHHGDAMVPVPRDQMHEHVFLKVVTLIPEARHLQHVAGSEGWSSYIVVNKLIDCVQLHDDTLAFCNVDPEPISFKVDIAFVPDCVLALQSLTIWQVFLSGIMVTLASPMITKQHNGCTSHHTKIIVLHEPMRF
jgi:hypothetical protein